MNTIKNNLKKDNSNEVKMVDISKTGLNKEIVYREAKATVKLSNEVINKIINNEVPKGNVLVISKTAGILAAKNTPNLIPLCHPLNPEFIDINFSIKENEIDIECIVKGQAKTGFEMEALVGVTIAALTIYDLCKPLVSNITIDNVSLIYKSKE
ncbi:MAG: cyclic pyranopterin monophosphate synthase MoaC [bacterium]